MNNLDTVSSHLVPDADRLAFTATLFGVDFPMRLEPAVFNMAGRLAPEYNGGYWQFYALSNGGFYMAPQSDALFAVSCDNGFEGQLSADALGIMASLYAFSNLSFGNDEFAQMCARRYHLLRDFMMEHAEVRAILGAID